MGSHCKSTPKQEFQHAAKSALYEVVLDAVGEMTQAEFMEPGKGRLTRGQEAIRRYLQRVVCEDLEPEWRRIVVSKSYETARKAVKKIKCKITEKPAITDPRAAFEKNQIIGTPRTFALGDIDSSWEKCDVIVEGQCEIAGQEHLYLETHG